MLASIPNTDTLTNFQGNPAPLLEHLKESGQPVVLTVDGKPEVVVQDAASYQRLIEVADRVSTIEGVQRGLEDVKHGRTRPFREVLEELRRKYEE